jgi:hypothetical protein
MQIRSKFSITVRWPSWRRVWFCIDSDVKSHSAVTQLTGSETPRQEIHCEMIKSSNISAVDLRHAKEKPEPKNLMQEYL